MKINDLHREYALAHGIPGTKRLPRASDMNGLTATNQSGYENKIDYEKSTATSHGCQQINHINRAMEHLGSGSQSERRKP